MWRLVPRKSLQPIGELSNAHGQAGGTWSGCAAKARVTPKGRPMWSWGYTLHSARRCQRRQSQSRGVESTSPASRNSNLSPEYLKALCKVGRVPNLEIHFFHVTVVLEDNHLPDAHRLGPIELEPAADVMTGNSRPTRFHAAVVGQRCSHPLISLKSRGLRLQREISRSRIGCLDAIRPQQSKRQACHAHIR